MTIIWRDIRWYKRLKIFILKFLSCVIAVNIFKFNKIIKRVW